MRSRPTTLLWFVQTLQLPPFAFRRRPTPAVACSGLAHVSMLGLICHGPRLSALQSHWMCSVSYTSLVSVTGPLFLCSALSFSSSLFRSQLRLLLRRDLSWCAPASITFISFAHLLWSVSFTYLFISCCRHCDKSFMWWQRPCVWFFIVSPQPKIVVGAPVIVK